MPFYEYECPDHGRFLAQRSFDEGGGDWAPCMVTTGTDGAGSGVTLCNLRAKRKFKLSIQTGMPTHYNQALGKEVSSQRQVKEGLKIASEEATERTGVAHDFQPVDLRDKEGLGVTEEGMEATNRAKRDIGQTESQFYSPG